MTLMDKVFCRVPAPLRSRAVIVFILLATLVAFLPVLRAGFISIDDGTLVYRNPLVTAFSLRTLPGLFTSFYERLYHPLVLISYGIEYRLFGDQAAAYHAVNLLLHLANALLVYMFFLLLTESTWNARLVALLFALHPQHVESVAWVSERKDVLYTFFFMGSLLFYVRYLRRDRTRDYYAALAAFILSLLSKPMAITLPLVLPLCDYYLGIRYERRRFIEKIPFFLLFIVFAVITRAGFYSGEYRNLPALYPWFQNVLVTGFGFLFYLAKILVPSGLSFGYPFAGWTADPRAASIVAAAAVSALLVLAALLSFRRSKTIFFGFFFFLITLSPALQLLWSGMRFVADKYTYVPALGIFFVVAGALSRLAARRSRAWLSIIFIAGTAVLGYGTRQRCLVWRDSITLFTDILEKYPSYTVYRNHRGVEYLNAARYDLAAADFRYIMQNDPSVWCARYNLGILNMRKGEYDGALECFDRLLAQEPACAQGYARRAETYWAMGNRDKALLDTKRGKALGAAFAPGFLDRIAR